MNIDIKNKLKQLLSELLKIDFQKISENMSLGSTDVWDSIKHMEIVFYIGEKYGIEPTPDHVLQMTSFKGLYELIINSAEIKKINNKQIKTYLNKDDFVEALVKVGLKKGDHVFVQSSIGNFGKINNPLETIKDSFLSVIGKNGTLTVPTFNSNFFQGRNFSVDNSKSESGIFSEFIRTSPGALRSTHPFHSIVSIGKKAKELSEVINNSSSFSRSSVFGKMYDFDYKVCMFGTTMKHNTYFHYIEEQALVPYRFFKTFTSTITYKGKTEECSYGYFARYLEPLIKADFHNVGEKLLEEFDGKKVFVGRGSIYLFSCKKFVDVMLRYLTNDPVFLIADIDKWKIKEIINGNYKK